MKLDILHNPLSQNGARVKGQNASPTYMMNCKLLQIRTEAAVSFINPS